MRTGVAGLGVASAVAERIKLLDIAQFQARLLGHPGAQANVERAVLQWRERAERQAIGRALCIRVLAYHQHDGFVVGHGDDCRSEADLDACRLEPDAWSETPRPV